MLPSLEFREPSFDRANLPFVQPLRDASEQYTRNHMSVTGRDLQSRFPQAPDIEDKRRL